MTPPSSSYPTDHDAAREYPKIDMHAHILPAGEWPDWKEKFGYGGFVRLEHRPDGNVDMVRDDGTFFRTVEPNCWDIEAKLRDMRDQDIDYQVLCTVPVMFNYWAKPEHCLETCRWLNDDLASTVSKHPDRLGALGTLPMQSVDLAVAELRRCMQELGMLGVQIGSHVNRLQLDDPVFDPLWAAAEELGAAILVHPWDMVGRETMPQYWMPWLVSMPATTTMAMCAMLMGGVFERFPRLKVCYAHGGGQFAFTIGRIDHGWEVRPDLCQTRCKKRPSSFIGSFWVDSIVHDDDALDLLVRRMGDDKVCLGSDQPFPLGEHVPGTLVQQSKSLTAEQKRRILFDNTADWLGLKDDTREALIRSRSERRKAGQQADIQTQ